MKKGGILVALVVGSVLGVSSLALAAGGLDGKAFSGEIGQQGKTDSQPDTFVFKDGAFESTLCTTFGYGKGAYRTEPKGDAVEFTAKTVSTDGGTMQWKGAVKGGQVEGTVVSTEKGQISTSWFKGALKKS